MRHSGFILALAVVTAGCGQAASQPKGVPPVQEQPLPDVAQIECEVNGARVLTPAVRPQANGVHLEVRNETGVDLSFSALTAEGGGQGSDAPTGTTTYVWSLPPGTIFVKCEDGSSDPSEIRGTLVEVVDQEGVWVSTDLHADCRRFSTTHADYAAGAQGEKGDPVEVARSALERQGLRPGDLVERAGYLEGAEIVVRIVREDRVVATVQLLDDGAGGWLQSVTTACDDPAALAPS